MAKAVKKTTVTKKTNNGTTVVVNQIQVRSVDRTKKDIQTYRNAHKTAESIFNPNRTQLYDLYDDILLDGHLTGIIEKRIAAVINKKIRFEVAGKHIEEMDELINSGQFRKMLRELMLQKMWGLTGLEFIPGDKYRFYCIPRKHIKPKDKVISIEQFGNTGISYDGVWNLWIVGDNSDFGLLLKCAYYALYKRGNLADWAQYIEIFGQPVRIAKYKANDVQTKNELQQVLNEAGSSMAIMIPEEANFDMKDGKQSNGDGQLQLSFHDTCNAEMSVIILGATENTTSSTSSGQAQAKEHGKQTDEVTKSDVIEIENLINSDQHLSILRSYGYAVPEDTSNCGFVFEKTIDHYEMAARMTIDKLFPAPLDDQYYYDAYDRPKPDNYDELKAQQEAERIAKLNHMNSSGVPTDEKGNYEEDGETGERTNEKGKDDSDGKENALRKAAKGRLAWNEYMWAKLTDFFGHGHKG